MAYSQDGQDFHRPAGVDLSSYQYKAMTINSSGAIIPCSSAGQKSVGVLQNNPVSGAPAIVRRFGVSRMISGGALALGSGPVTITTSNAGKTASASSGHYPLGFLLEAAGADGTHVTVMVDCSLVPLA